jgi:hypothetical protein
MDLDHYEMPEMAMIFIFFILAVGRSHPRDNKMDQGEYVPCSSWVVTEFI